MILHLGKCEEILSGLPDNSVDSVVTDPPYGISFMGKKWDIDVPSVSIFKECLRVLKPGGHFLCFAGTRTYHRMAVNIEDAGFEVRDMISWVYGSGFPKALDVSKAIDQLKGAERERDVIPDKRSKLHGDRPWMNDPDHKFQNNIPITKQAKQWDGWKSALKPAFEPICLARKPLSENSMAENVILYGTGALNIDGTRIDYNVKESNLRKDKGNWNAAKQGGGGLPGTSKSRPRPNPSTKGRYPANFIHDGGEEVERLFPNSTSTPRSPSKNHHTGNVTNFQRGSETSYHNDSGSASRFFYVAKASKEDRDEGLRLLNKKEKSGSYNFKINGSLDGKKTMPKSNVHPTVKPTDLMRYLCRMITPPGGVVLDPFMGSGSTGKGAMLEGFDFIGIEMDIEYYKIAKARIKSAQAKGHQTKLF